LGGKKEKREDVFHKTLTDELPKKSRVQRRKEMVKRRPL
jgi:hypothetical protein